MIKMWVIGWTTTTPTYPEVVAEEAGWAVDTFMDYSNAGDAWESWKKGSSWNSKKVKAMFFAELRHDWEEGFSDLLMLEKKAHPHEKMVMYNKQEIAPKEVAPKMPKFKIGGWKAPTINYPIDYPNGASDAPIPNDYFLDDEVPHNGSTN